MRGFETGIEKCARIYTKDAKVRVVWGDKCATDGAGTIYLPALSDSINPHILNRTRLNMGHEVAHVLHSDFSLIKKVLESGGLGKKTILNSVEDVRIERLWELEYTGCQEDFREDYKHFVRNEFNTRLRGPETIFSKVLNLLIIRSREKQLGFDAGLVVPKVVEKLFQEKLADLVDSVASFTTMKEVEDCTEVIYKRFKEVEPEPEKDKSKPEKGKGGKSKPKDKTESDSDGPGDGSDGEPDSGPDSDRDNDGPSSEEDEGPSKGDGEDEGVDSGEGSDSPSGGRSKGGTEDEGEDDYDPTAEGSTPGWSKPKSELDKLKEELKASTEKGEEIKAIQDSRIKEVNAFAETCQEYLVDPGVSDIIFKPAETPRGKETATILMADGKKILSYVGQRLQHLFVSKQSRRVARFLKTGPLDSYRIMEDESDLICKKKLKGRAQDAVVGFSIDKSGSMTEDGKDSLATKLSLATGYFLEQIKVPFMAVGLTGDNQYHSTRTNPVTIYILKEFQESIRKVMGRFVGLSMRQNSDLDGMKYLAQHILRRPEPKKIIFVFSDGLPCSGSSTLDNKHLYSYKNYIKRLQRSGVIVFGFGIMHNVEHIFGKEFSINVNASNLNEFPRIVFKQLSKILLE